MKAINHREQRDCAEGFSQFPLVYWLVGKRRGLGGCFIIVLLTLLISTAQTDSTTKLQTVSDSTQTDTTLHANTFITDTLQNEFVLKLIFKPYETILNTLDKKPISVIGRERVLPTIKEIKVRNTQNQNWIFWLSIILILFISITRIANPRQFEIFVAAVFDTQANEKLWSDKNRNYIFLYIALFLFYVSTLAFFIATYSIKEGLIQAEDYLPLIFSTATSLLVIYAGKFAIYFFTGFLIDTGRLISAIVASIFSINAVLALIIFPLVVFYAYSSDENIGAMFYHTIFAVFVLGLIFRFIRFISAGNSYFKYSNIYLFVYLCALEICPWLVIVKLFKHFIT